MLIEILKQIFEEFGYLYKDFNVQDYEVLLFYKEEIDNYYIIVDKESITSEEVENFENIMNELFTTIKEDDSTNESFDKNTTLIMCLNGKIDNSIINNLEENPYIFKKNTITYNNTEIDLLNELLSSSYSYENLILTLNNEEIFERYKITEDIGYKLLVKLFIKLPFLKFQRQIRNLENLSEIIQTKVTEQSLEAIYNILNTEAFNIQDISSYEDLISISLLQESENE